MHKTLDCWATYIGCEAKWTSGCAPWTNYIRLKNWRVSTSRGPSRYIVGHLKCMLEWEHFKERSPSSYWWSTKAAASTLRNCLFHIVFLLDNYITPEVWDESQKTNCFALFVFKMKRGKVGEVGPWVAPPKETHSSVCLCYCMLNHHRVSLSSQEQEGRILQDLFHFVTQDASREELSLNLKTFMNIKSN